MKTIKTSAKISKINPFGTWRNLAMNFSKILVFVLFSFALLAADLVVWDTPESEKRISRSNYKKDFFILSNHFQAQTDKLICGPTTGAIVLNAFRIPSNGTTPKTSLENQSLKENLPDGFDPRLGKFTPRSFISHKASRIKTWEQIYGKPINGRKDYGLQLRQLHKIFELHGLKSALRVVDEKLTLEKMKEEMLSNLKRKGDFVIVNYARKSLGQKGGGHISPVGAYDKTSDSFLVMDVNPNTAHWVWVKSEDLYKSMKTFDTIENRGYLLLSQ